MILELKNISLSFTGGKNSFKILNDLNFNIKKGKITALVGGNGAGKTTLFNVISGFQKDYKGEILFKGESVGKCSSDAIARKGIGRLFQGKPLFPDLTLLENMKLASNDVSGESPFSYLFNRKRIDRKEREKELQAIKILAQLFGINSKYVGMVNHELALVNFSQKDRTLNNPSSELDRCNDLFIESIINMRDTAMSIKTEDVIDPEITGMLHYKGSQLSYGDQRLISLARLFMGNYSLLLLDEPTAGVNPMYINTIKDIIQQMVSVNNATVLLIEHNMPFVNGIADYCAYISDGSIRYQGTADEVLNNQEVKNSYLGMN
jgi:branched-chain amino acid transport system ATP-binding protein